MRLYKDYKEERERAVQEEADRQYLNAPDVVIIYEAGAGSKVKRCLLAAVLLAMAGLAAGYALTVFF